jgi:hypothetical protein
MEAELRECREGCFHQESSAPSSPIPESEAWAVVWREHQMQSDREASQAAAEAARQDVETMRSELAAVRQARAAEWEGWQIAVASALASARDALDRARARHEATEEAWRVECANGRAAQAELQASQAVVQCQQEELAQAQALLQRATQAASAAGGGTQQADIAMQELPPPPIYPYMDISHHGIAMQELPLPPSLHPSDVGGVDAGAPPQVLTITLIGGMQELQVRLTQALSGERERGEAARPPSAKAWPPPS